jgi:hypothetical protein
MASALKKVAKVPGIASVDSPYAPDGAAQISRDGTIAFARVHLGHQSANITRADADHLIAATPKAIHRRLRPAQVEELVIGYRTGPTVYQLAEQFRINRGTVSNLLEREGIPRRGRPLSPAQIEQATELYANGLSFNVGRRLGCDRSTVHLAVRKAGVGMRDNHGRDR